MESLCPLKNSLTCISKRLGQICRRIGQGFNTLAELFAAAHRNWTNLGSPPADKMATLTFYSSTTRYQAQIANPLNSCVAITPTFNITANGLLNIAS
ncbi:hypothetical protein PSHT_00363 [Puccinia striiformis]|uniref:Uncharacterized protein n=3 Tax=Puccinia striiformis TaxID=27350 RepID=A0A0L0VV60_9BASI|nr:hypothetical protein H4Q26_014132 [Puccinia striiformis f. sp. tritici PST-130]KNF03151.1 hypothetical protein PSTG_03738 [Puccinia striiformis f. sp. tritici PST-78]POW10937.1 hypothetical protein PSTT_05649 [Puccinia striiformis]POW23233.1 hypothetical protein PSHT_00363 [Puccinia striiformis]